MPKLLVIIPDRSIAFVEEMKYYGLKKVITAVAVYKGKQIKSSIFLPATATPESIELARQRLYKRLRKQAQRIRAWHYDKDIP